MTFDEVWKLGRWQKLGRIQASRRWAKLSTAARSEFVLAMYVYNEYCVAHPDYTPKWGSTFFGERQGWREWVPEERPELSGDDAECMHECIACDPPHPWACPKTPGVGCVFAAESPCPEWVRAFEKRRVRA